MQDRLLAPPVITHVAAMIERGLQACLAVEQRAPSAEALEVLEVVEAVQIPYFPKMSRHAL
jgi:hypothetical protein